MTTMTMPAVHARRPGPRAWMRMIQAEVKMKTVIVDEWLHLNSNPPIWVRYVFLYGLMYIY